MILKCLDYSPRNGKTKIRREMEVFGGFAAVTSQFHIVHVHAFGCLWLPNYTKGTLELSYEGRYTNILTKTISKPHPLYEVKLFSDLMLSLLPYSLECFNTISHLLKPLLHFTSITSSSLKTDLKIYIFCLWRYLVKKRQVKNIYLNHCKNFFFQFKCKNLEVDFTYHIKCFFTYFHVFYTKFGLSKG